MSQTYSDGSPLAPGDSLDDNPQGGWPEPEQTLRLADTSNMLRCLAEAEIKIHGEYLCVVDGKRTRIVR